MIKAASRPAGWIAKLACTGTIAALLSVGAHAANTQGKGMHNIEFRHVIDLSHTITTDIPLWPGDPAVEFETVATLENDGYYLRSFSIGEHSGTHMNAPNSFHADGIGIDQYRPQSLVRPLVVIDVRDKTLHNPDYVISQDDVLAWERQHGRVAKGSVVAFYTGWQKFWNSPEKFFNADAQGDLHFPGVGAETTRFLLEERGIAGVGIDTHGVDPGLDEEYATNTQVLDNNGIILENLTNLHLLPAKGTTIVIGILRLQAGSGSPVSVMAFVP
jgi:kynurenine formamidase